MGRVPLVVGDAQATLLVPALAVGVGRAVPRLRATPAGAVRRHGAACDRADPARHARRRRAGHLHAADARRAIALPSVAARRPGARADALHARHRALTDRGARHDVRALVRGAHAVLRPAGRLADLGAAHAGMDARRGALVHRRRDRDRRPRRARVGRALPGLGPLRLRERQAHPGPVRRPERVRPVPRAGSGHLLRGSHAPSPAALAALARAVLVHRPRHRRGAVVLARRDRQPRARVHRDRDRVRPPERPAKGARAGHRDPPGVRGVRGRHARADRRDHDPAAACPGPGLRLAAASRRRRSRSTRAPPACSATGRAPCRRSSR